MLGGSSSACRRRKTSTYAPFMPTLVLQTVAGGEHPPAQHPQRTVDARQHQHADPRVGVGATDAGEPKTVDHVKKGVEMGGEPERIRQPAVSYTHLRAH